MVDIALDIHYNILENKGKGPEMSFAKNLINIALGGTGIVNHTSVDAPNKGEIYRLWFDNDPDHKSYVGQTVQGTLSRIKQHIDDAQKNDGTGCPLLDDATRRFGIQHMRYEILEDGIETHEDLDRAEQYWIKRYNSRTPYGYNVKLGGQGKGCTPIDPGPSGTLASKNPIAAAVAESLLDRSSISDNAKGLLRSIIR